MLKRFVSAIAIAAAVFIGTARGQQPVSDTACAALMDTCEETLLTRPYKALEQAAQARLAAEQLGDSLLMARAYRVLGQCYYKTRVYHLAMELQFKAFRIYSLMDRGEGMAGCMVDIARNYRAQDIYGLAETYAIKAVEIGRKRNYPEQTADAMAELGKISIFTNEDLAIPNMREAKRVYDSLKLERKSTDINVSIARAYTRLNLNDSALNILEENLEKYAQEGDKNKLASTYMTLGDTYNNSGDVQKSNVYYKTALHLYQDAGMDHEIHICRLKMASLQLDTRDYNQALTNALLAFQEAERDELQYGNDEISLKHRACKIIYQAYQHLGQQDLALHYCERFAQTGDSLFMLRKREQYSEFHVSLESQQQLKDIELNQMNAEKELLKEETNTYKQDIIILILVVALVIAIVILYYHRYKEKERNNASLSMSNARMEQEIRERKIAEAELRNSEEKYRILFSKTPVGIVQYNDKLAITAANERFVQIFGLNSSRIIGQDIYTVIPQKTFDEIKDSDRTKKHELCLDTPSGKTTLSITMSSGLDSSDGGILMVEDITDHIKAEENSMIYQSASNNIINLMPEAIFLLDSKANYVFARVPQLPISEQNAYVGKNMRDMLAPEILLPFLVAFNTVRKTGEPQFAEYQAEDNPDCPVFNEAQFIGCDGDKVLVTIRDISRQKLRESKLKTAKNNAESGSKAKSEFILGMTTEIKPPLEAILRNCELLVANIKDSNSSALLKDVLNSALFVNETFTDILKLTEVEAVNKKAYTKLVNPVEVAKDVYEIFNSRAQEKNLDYIFQADEDVPQQLMLDEVRLRQILFNILSNGIKYTETGSVTLNISSSKTDDSLSLLFTVTDTGVGLSQEQMESIFSSHNGKKGMALTKKMADAMKAKVSVESVEGQGSKFTFLIPDIVTEKAPAKQTIDISTEHLHTGDKSTISTTRKRHTDAMREYISVLKYAVIPEYKAMKNEISFKVLTDFVARFREQSLHYHIDKGVEIADELMLNIQNYDIQNITMNIRRLETYITNNINELQGNQAAD